MDKVNEFVSILKKQFDVPLKISAAWGKVKSVDWPNKTAVITGVADNLDYYDVVLGLTGCTIKPKTDSLVLIGVVGRSGAYLIWAEEIEEMNLKIDKVTINSKDIIIDNGDEGGVPKAQSIANRFNELELALNEIKNVFSSHSHAFVGTGSVGSPTVPLTYPVPNSQKSDFENTEFKH